MPVHRPASCAPIHTPFHCCAQPPIHSHSLPQIVGLNNNAYQVHRAGVLTQREGLTGQVTFQRGDFMRLPFAPGSFDAAYAIEATCHAPDRTACFTEIYKALKPGAVFGGYEWVTTDKFEPSNPAHALLKKEIEVRARGGWPSEGAGIDFRSCCRSCAA